MAELTPPPIDTQEPTPPVESTPPVEAPPVEAPSTDVPTDAQEWSDASKEVFPGLPEVKQSNETTTETTTVTETTTAAPVTDTQTTAPPVTPPTEPPLAAPPAPVVNVDEVAARVAGRYNQASVDSMKAEIKKQIMPKVPVLTANDGFEIKTARDLETIEDPRTPGKPFTPQAAEEVFKNHARQVAEVEQAAEARATKIATVYQGLEDEATLAMNAYKDVFTEYPELQKSMYNAYTKTLRLGEDGMIEDAPVSLLGFYHDALSPYMKMKQAAPAAPATPEAQPAPPVDPTKRHQDRSDIYKPTNSTLSKDEEEWAEAARDVLGVK